MATEQSGAKTPVRGKKRKQTQHEFMKQMTHKEREAYYYGLFEHGPKQWAEHSDVIQYEKDKEKHVARIIINNPEFKNSIPHGAYPRMTHFIRQAEYDDDVKTLIFKAVGPDFGTGANVGELGFMIGFGDGTTPEELKRPTQHRRLWFDRDMLFGPRGVEGALQRFSKVSIFAVKGYCYGFHFQLAMAADLVIAAEDTLFSHPAWRYLGPVFNYYNLLETVGKRATAEMLFTGGPFTAQRAYQLGMVNAVVPKDKVEQEAEEWAAAVVSRPLDGIVMGKVLMEMIAETRGQTNGSMCGYLGHTWMTNQVLREDEFNFTKQRRDKGVSQTLVDVDMRLPARFRMSRRRRALP